MPWTEWPLGLGSGTCAMAPLLGPDLPQGVPDTHGVSGQRWMTEARAYALNTGVCGGVHE